MKKILISVLVFVIMAFSCISASAAGINSYEQSVLGQMRTPANMAGNSVYVPTSYVNQAESYFNTIDMTAQQASQINSNISAGRSFLESTGKSSVKELTSAELKTLMSYASAAAGVLNLSAAAGSDVTQVKVIDKDGNVIVDDTGKIIKTTGASLSPIPFAVLGALGFIAVASCAGVIFLKKRVAVENEEC